MTLPMDGDTGMTEWTYPVYGYGSVELNALLASDGWKGAEDLPGG